MVAVGSFTDDLEAQVEFGERPNLHVSKSFQSLPISRERSSLKKPY
jgi:hypothetical protein